MIGIALSLMLLAAPNPQGGEVLVPGSLEDCLAWKMADLELAGEDDRWRLRPPVSNLMGQHFQSLIERGAPPVEILRRQRVLHRIAVNRAKAGGGAAERAVCDKAFPMPTVYRR
jgi:hypothetical protein